MLETIKKMIREEDESYNDYIKDCEEQKRLSREIEKEKLEFIRLRNEFLRLRNEMLRKKLKEMGIEK